MLSTRPRLQQVRDKTTIINLFFLGNGELLVQEEGRFIEVGDKGLAEEGVSDYSYVQLAEHYRRGMLRFLSISVTMLAHADFENKAGRAVIDLALPHLSGLTDWDCGSLIPDQKRL